MIYINSMRQSPYSETDSRKIDFQHSMQRSKTTAPYQKYSLLANKMYLEHLF